MAVQAGSNQDAAVTTKSSSNGLLRGRLGTTIVTVVASGLLVFLVMFMVWYHLGGGAWRSGVRISEAKLEASDTLILTVDSCEGAPAVARLDETSVDVQVKVVAFSTPLHGGTDCQESVNAYLEEPLGTRTVVDMHTGESVSVSKPK